MKAVSLFSGGLDSQLAVCVVKEQGIEVVGAHFKTPFFGGDEHVAEAARNLGIELLVLDRSDEYLEVLKNPRYGYGKHMNPCTDCHGFMLKHTGHLMDDIGAKFIVTGEVLGQRPKSQNKAALRQVEKLSGYEGYILRPLSAKLLPPTIPELEGWVDRERLLDICGRSRLRQMELAEKYGLNDYPSPAGGCLLTQENFSRRLQKFMNAYPEAKADDMYILRCGRHIYLSASSLLVVGRNQEENSRIQSLAKPGDYLLKVKAYPGPTGLLRVATRASREELTEAAAIVARYSDAREAGLALVQVRQPIGSEEEITVSPLAPSDTPASI
ncbi:DUF814 domain-containing protein [Syntrophothermus lipocalidus]|uniref:Queuosine synthesis n=1 Tax=Syntrophothermus lipocalidus (strain DSM 12680 / TGB-C1) TaxID=643648 RepID=D7CMG4_SYNLT|nr:DUF814 domain-containing protein [Syntrophothermus lipocalidus]ADI01899.1 Queuosine synthesis [Syntrophothermus lipocalidus DSM 12680]